MPACKFCGEYVPSGKYCSEHDPKKIPPPADDSGGGGSKKNTNKKKGEDRNQTFGKQSHSMQPKGGGNQGNSGSRGGR